MPEYFSSSIKLSVATQNSDFAVTIKTTCDNNICLPPQIPKLKYSMLTYTFWLMVKVNDYPLYPDQAVRWFFKMNVNSKKALKLINWSSYKQTFCLKDFVKVKNKIWKSILLSKSPSLPCIVYVHAHCNHHFSLIWTIGFHQKKF